jgi:hypothetical protein
MEWDLYLQGNRDGVGSVVTRKHGVVSVVTRELGVGSVVTRKQMEWGL